MKAAIAPLLTILLSVLCTSALAQPIRMEAEDMFLDVMRTERLDSASNGEIINLKGPGANGSAIANFPGSSGDYDVVVVYHDENDGVAQLTLSIAGVPVDSWLLDQRISGARQATDSNRMARQVAMGYSIREGDVVRIDAVQGNWDHVNVDYVEFTQILPLGRATVAKVDGDYENPLDAMDDIDAWCPDAVRAGDGCFLDIQTGHYVLDRTLVVPNGMAVNGSFTPNTVLTAASGLDVAVRLGDGTNASNVNLGNITVENVFGNGANSTGVLVSLYAGAVLQEVHVLAEGSNINVAIDAGDEEANATLANVRAEARSGSEATGLLAARVAVENSVIVASDAITNRGVVLNTREGGDLSVARTTVRVAGGEEAIGITQRSAELGRVTISQSSIYAADATVRNWGLGAGGLDTDTDVRDTYIRVSGSGSSANIGISYSDPTSEDQVSRFDNVAVDVRGGGDNTAFRVFELFTPLTITRSKFSALGAANSNVGILLEFDGDSLLSVGTSRITAPSAALRTVGRRADSFSEGFVRLSFSTLEGPIVQRAIEPVDVTCNSVTDENQAFFLDTCPSVISE